MTSPLYGFFHVFSSDYLQRMICHNMNKKMAFLLYGFFHVLLNYFCQRMVCHNVNKKMASHWYGFFHVISSEHSERMFYHNVNKKRASDRYEFSHVFLVEMVLEISCCSTSKNTLSWKPLFSLLLDFQQNSHNVPHHGPKTF